MRHVTCKLFALLLAIMLLLAGCGKVEVEIVDPNAPEVPDTPVTEPETPAESKQITDPATLKKLWDTYFYHGYFAIQHEYHSPKSVNPGRLGSYVIDRMMTSGEQIAIETATMTEAMAEGAPFDTPSVGENIYLLSPRELADWYERCFAMTIDNAEEYFSSIELYTRGGPYYLPAIEKMAFTYNTVEDAPPYDQRTWFDMELSEVWEYPDGTMEGVMDFYTVVNEQETLQKRHTMTLVPNGEEYRIKSQIIDYMPIETTVPEGTFAVVKGLEPDDSVPTEALTLVAEDDDGFILYYVEEVRTDAEYTRVHLIRVNKETLTAEKHVWYGAWLIPDVFYYSDVAVYATEEGIRICHAREVTDIGFDLDLIRGSMLPVGLVEAMDVPSPYKAGNDVDFFRDYVVSDDLKVWYWSDEGGLWRFEVDTLSTDRVVEPVIGEGKLLEGAILVPSALQLSQNGEYLFYGIPSYEGWGGLYLLQDSTRTSSELVSPSGMNYVTAYQIDRSGIMLQWWGSAGASECAYISFEDGSMTEIPDRYFSMLNGDMLAQETAGKTRDIRFSLYGINTKETKDLDCVIHMVGEYVIPGRNVGLLRDGRVLYAYTNSPVDSRLIVIG